MHGVRHAKIGAVKANRVSGNEGCGITEAPRVVGCQTNNGLR